MKNRKVFPKRRAIVIPCGLLGKEKSGWSVSGMIDKLMKKYVGKLLRELTEKYILTFDEPNGSIL